MSITVYCGEHPVSSRRSPQERVPAKEPLFHTGREQIAYKETAYNRLHIRKVDSKTGFKKRVERNTGHSRSLQERMRKPLMPQHNKGTGSAPLKRIL